MKDDRAVPTDDRVWCVRHRDGWCAAKANKKPREGVNSVATLCGFHVVLPWGFSEREPTCDLCKAKLAKRRGNCGA